VTVENVCSNWKSTLQQPVDIIISHPIETLAIDFSQWVFIRGEDENEMSRL